MGRWCLKQEEIVAAIGKLQADTPKALQDIALLPSGGEGKLNRIVGDEVTSNGLSSSI